MSDEVTVFETNLVYPGTLSREEAIAILGFDPDLANGEIDTFGYVTHVDKERGLIIISSKIP